MPVRLNITMDEELYRRLKKDLPPSPSRKALDAAYKAASRERWRLELAEHWEATEGEAWPD